MYYTIRQMAELSASRSIRCGSIRTKGLLPCAGRRQPPGVQRGVGQLDAGHPVPGAAARPLRTFRNTAACACWRNRGESADKVRHHPQAAEEAYRRLEEAKATVKYMEDKAAHYEAILAGLHRTIPTLRIGQQGDQPEHETCSFS